MQTRGSWIWKVARDFFNVFVLLRFVVCLGVKLRHHRFISGRWLSISAYETNIMRAAATPSQCCDVWTTILQAALPRKSTKAPAAKVRKVEGASEEALVQTDDPHIEEMKEFSAKMGRWSLEVTAAVSDHDLWAMISAMHRSRAPLDHLMRFVDSPGDRTTAGNHVFRLATGDAYRIFGEFNDIVSGEVRAMTSSSPKISTDGLLNRFGLFAALFHAASYYRRVMLPLSHPPFVYFLLVRSPMDVQCRIRQRPVPSRKCRNSQSQGPQETCGCV